MSKIGLIIEREYMTRVNKKSFILLTLLVPVLILAVVFIPVLLSQIKGDDIKEVAVIDRTGQYKEVLKDFDEYKFINVASAEETPREYFNHKGDGLYAILEITGDLIENPQQIMMFSEKTINKNLTKEVTDQFDEYLSARKIESFNIPDLKNIIDESKISLDIQTMKWGDEGQESNSSAEMAAAIGLSFTFLIYMFIFAYGGMVMTSVMQEKTNRIVEVMVSSVKPMELMMGKILAIALVGLTQFTIWMLLILGASTVMGIGATATMSPEMMQGGMSPALSDPTMVQEINSMLGGINFTQIIICFIIYFIGGYLTYAAMFAAIGSMVDQDSDSQQFMMPISLIIVFAMYAAIASIENPDGPLAVWCSMIPLTSPIVMMVRMPFDVPVWQIAVSMLLLFGTFIGITALAAKIYRTGILMYGKKVTWKEMIKWLRY